jgi:hypothetical protein
MPWEINNFKRKGKGRLTYILSAGPNSLIVIAFIILVESSIKIVIGDFIEIFFEIELTEKFCNGLQNAFDGLKISALCKIALS